MWALKVVAAGKLDREDNPSPKWQQERKESKECSIGANFFGCLEKIPLKEFKQGRLRQEKLDLP